MKAGFDQPLGVLCNICRLNIVLVLDYIGINREVHMNPFKGKLKEIAGGKILDVGTSEGDFTPNWKFYGDTNIANIEEVIK